jgi:hypothetical protein
MISTLKHYESDSKVLNLRRLVGVGLKAKK